MFWAIFNPKPPLLLGFNSFSQSICKKNKYWNKSRAQPIKLHKRVLTLWSCQPQLAYLNSCTICCVPAALAAKPLLKAFTTWGSFQKWQWNNVIEMSYISALYLQFFSWQDFEQKLVINSKNSRMLQRKFSFSSFPEWCQGSSPASKGKISKTTKKEERTDTQLAKRHLESRDHLHLENSMFEFLFAWILKRCRGIWKMGNGEEKEFLVHGY